MKIGQFTAVKAEQVMMLFGIRIVTGHRSGMCDPGDQTEPDVEVQGLVDSGARNLWCLSLDDLVDLFGSGMSFAI